MKNDDIFNHFLSIQKDIVKMLEKKNNKYGDTNLLDMGLFGLVVRMNDKIQRMKQVIRNHLDTKNNKLTPEEIFVVRDQLMDLQGYSINVIRLLEENKMTIFGNLFDDLKEDENT